MSSRRAGAPNVLGKWHLTPEKEQGPAGIVAIYDRAKTDLVNTTLISAVRKSVAQIDGGGAKELKAALAQAQAGMGG